MSALVEASARSEKSNRAKCEFLSRMSHELRTPLNAMLGSGQVPEVDELTDRQREHVKHLLNGGRHLLGLIHEVVELSRIEADELAMAPEPAPRAETTSEAMALLTSLTAAGEVRLSAGLSGPATDGHAHADRQRLKQMLKNVLSNVIQYSRTGGAGRGLLRIPTSRTHPNRDGKHRDRNFPQATRPRV